MEIFALLAAGALTEIGSEKWLENLIQSLNIMWKGVLAIFIVITIVIIAVKILTKVGKKNSDQEKKQ